MSAQVSILKGNVLAMAAVLVVGTAGSAVAGPVGGGHAGGGGFHGGYAGGWGGHAYSGWHGGGYYGGWHGYHGGYYGPWRGGWGWAGWRYGCCGWGWPWIGLGWYVPVLPFGYTTVWWGGVPYYYANNDYYVWNGNVGQYEAVQPPSATSSGIPSTHSPPAQNAAGNGNWTDLFAYPKGGQSLEQQTRDREECRTWAVGQTGFDPTKPTSDSPKDWGTKRDGYLRAEGACLEARNYSVK